MTAESVAMVEPGMTGESAASRGEERVAVPNADADIEDVSGDLISSLATDTEEQREKHYFTAIGGMLLANGVISGWNRFVTRLHWA